MKFPAKQTVNRCIPCLLGLFLYVPGCNRTEKATSGDPEKAAERKEGVAGEGSWENVTALFEKAKSSGETTAASAAEWISELYDDAKDVSANAVEDANAWVQEMFQDAKRKGETTAGSAKEWVQADLKKRGTFTYRVVNLSGQDTAATEQFLNKLGGQRWECFHIERRDDVTTFYLKKAGRSKLRSLPAKELLRLLPLLGSLGGDGDA